MKLETRIKKLKCRRKGTFEILSYLKEEIKIYERQLSNLDFLINDLEKRKEGLKDDG